MFSENIWHNKKCIWKSVYVPSIDNIENRFPPIILIDVGFDSSESQLPNVYEHVTRVLLYISAPKIASPIEIKIKSLKKGNGKIVSKI